MRALAGAQPARHRPSEPQPTLHAPPAHLNFLLPPTPGWMDAEYGDLVKAALGGDLVAYKLLSSNQVGGVLVSSNQ